MIPLGKPMHIAHNGLLILRSKKIPKLGALVSDEKSNPVGSVFDIFGPINYPFVAVKLTKKVIFNDLPDMLYLLPKKKARPKKLKTKRKQYSKKPKKRK